MKAIMVMFDSLNRHLLEPYGCDWTKTPNFARLAEHTVTFDNFYAGSLPCMPARRELHTGRYNFLHRAWGPIEGYDDSMPEILKSNGIYTHLVTDHWHYWEEGGANYQTKYNSFEYARGQEGDPWKGHLKWDVPEHIDGRQDACGRQEYINRYYMREEKNQAIAVTFQNGLDFIETNHAEDNWFLQIEAFDPHEPFFSPQKYKDLYPHEYHGIMFDWPAYHPVRESEEAVQHCRYEYAALLSMCDAYLGKVLDMMDQYGLWEDTMLIVNTDHGFLLGEHNWWGKIQMLYYNEIAHTPFFLWDPRLKLKNVRSDCLAQTIDIAPTVLDFFGQAIPKDMLGRPLRQCLESGTNAHDYVLFGQHGMQVYITDGRYVYVRSPLPDKEDVLYNYMSVPNSYPNAMPVEVLRTGEWHPGFSFTKGVPLMKYHGGSWIPSMQQNGKLPESLHAAGNLLFDLETDPKQLNPIDDPQVEERMIRAMVKLMLENDSPAEQFERLGLESYLPTP